MEKQKSMELAKQQQPAEEEESSHYNRGGLNNLPPLRCIVKLGGAAITYKHEIEKINEENLRTVSSQLRQAMMTESSSAKVSGMDWSKGLGNLEVPTADDFEKNPMLNAGNFVIVHGAGSFGHFQASRSGVHKGGLQLPFVKAGFVATRISVTSLNLEIVRALAREGIPSVGMSPFACGWSTCERNIAHADIFQLSKTIDSGFVPVLHGDAVFDDLQGCTILSGDVIIRHLAELLCPKYVVFLTDVLGVYDRPPQDSKPVLLREIGERGHAQQFKSNASPVCTAMSWDYNGPGRSDFKFQTVTAVDEDGSWSIVKPILDRNKQVEITVASHDTTGGMATKISEAAMIAKLGIDVYIVKAGTNHSLRALTGEITRSIPDDWLGTVIRFSKRTNATD